MNGAGEGGPKNAILRDKYFLHDQKLTMVEIYYAINIFT